MDTVTISVLSLTGDLRGKYESIFEDPCFYITVQTEEEYHALSINHGDTIRRETPNGATEDRRVIGVTVESSFIAVVIRILAPVQVSTPKPNADFIKMDGVELRAGTIIIGGRDSGFYDAEGVIVEAKHIGGNPEKFEDWAYYVIGKSNYEQDASQWLLLNNIGLVDAGPSSLFNFEFPKNSKIDDLLRDGEQELLAYLVSHPDAIGTLTGKQFEAVMESIYRNLGFDVESVGQWNQADGGVDLIAISRTEASTDFRIAIQCKASKNKITAKPIRELAGVLEKFKAHQGIVATTSRFTGPARKETEGHMWRLALQDRDTILRRLMTIVRPDFQQFIEALEAQTQRKDA